MERIKKINVTYGLDFIGDIHGCYDEFIELLDKLGYKANQNGLYTHPKKRRIISLGDVMSRGPKSLLSMQFFYDHVKNNLAYMIDSNHGWKIARWLDGRKVELKHGDEKVEQDFLEYQHSHGIEVANKLKRNYKDLFFNAPSHLIFSMKNESDIIAVHAGIRDDFIGFENKRIKDFCRYGDVDGMDEKGKPIRKEWYLNHKSSEIIIWGHDPKPEPFTINNTINIDQGVVFGGKLTAYRYPEKELVFVNAKKDYAGVPDNPIR